MRVEGVDRKGAGLMRTFDTSAYRGPYVVPHTAKTVRIHGRVYILSGPRVKRAPRRQKGRAA